MTVAESDAPLSVCPHAGAAEHQNWRVKSIRIKRTDYGVLCQELLNLDVGFKAVGFWK